MKPINVTNVTLQFDTSRKDITVEDVKLYLNLFNEKLSKEFESLQPQIILNKESVVQVIELIDK
jgi:NADPH-dependent 7-cyano-7-deazaguanine reductase QueF-like protein